LWNYIDIVMGRFNKGSIGQKKKISKHSYTIALKNKTSAERSKSNAEHFEYLIQKHHESMDVINQLYSSNQQLCESNRKLIDKLKEKSKTYDLVRRKVKRAHASMNELKSKIPHPASKVGRKRKTASNEVSSATKRRRRRSAARDTNNLIDNMIKADLDQTSTIESIKHLCAIPLLQNQQANSETNNNFIGYSACKKRKQQIIESIATENEKDEKKMTTFVEESSISLKQMTSFKRAMPKAKISISRIQKQRVIQNKTITQQLGITMHDKGSLVDPYCLLSYLVTSGYHSIEQNQTAIDLLIQGDGRQSSKTYGSVVFTLTIINYNSSENRSKIYTLGIMKCSESHDDLEANFSPLFGKLNCLQSKGITLNNKHYSIRLFLCSDWKMVKNIKGLGSPATSTYFCIWCHCTKANRHEPPNSSTERFNINDRRFNHKVGTMSLVAKDLMPFISPNFIIIDLLHMLLRISDTLTSVFIADAIDNSNDEEAAKKSIENEFSRIKIHFAFRLASDKKCDTDYEYTSLQGRDKLNMMRNFNCYTAFSGKQRDKAKYFNETFRSFVRVYDQLNMSSEELKMNSLTHVDIQSDIDSFMYRFNLNNNKAKPGHISKSLGFQSSLITPYMHVMFMHATQQIKMRGELKLFSCQRIERLNQSDNRTYFVGISRRTGQVERDILLKQYRIIFNDSNSTEIEYNYKCKCGKEYISYVPYYKHTTKVCGETKPSPKIINSNKSGTKA
jgi:hypothetical protein